MNRRFAAFAAVTLLAAVFSFPVVPEGKIHTFAEPIDAVSLGVEIDKIGLAVSGLVDGEWTEPVALELEKEFDPLLRESNLVLFPGKATAIRITGSDQPYEVHPIRVSNEPASYQVAALGNFPSPRIYSRSAWGADESLLYRTQPSTYSTGTSDASGEVPERVRDCEANQRNYPQEFAIEQVVGTHGGQTLRWQRQYSPEVVQLVVHHTAMEVGSDNRSGLERMRALYEYHSKNRGWGDVGYHYIIDEDGRIYEGRSGGDYVVGGHAYCNNIGTVGVAMMGNFEKEQPTHDQTTSLQWLLDHLAQKYDIDTNGTVVRRGKRMPTIVGHGDIISTVCPGYYVRSTMGQIRRHVASKDFDSRLTYPIVQVENRVDSVEDRRLQRLRERGLPIVSQQWSVNGDSSVISRPGANVRIQLQFQAQKLHGHSEQIGTVERSNARIGIWDETDGKDVRVRDELLAPSRLGPGEKATIQLRLQMPRQAGTYTVDVGDATIVLKSEGRRIRQPVSSSTYQTFSTADRQNTQTSGYRRARARQNLGITRTVATPRTTASATQKGSDETIRIRLSHTAPSVRIETSTNVYMLQAAGNSCQLYENGRLLEQGVVRITPSVGGLSTIASWPTEFNVFRGVIECRVVDGQLALINELPVEDYMAGLGEEPDTEPYEKQKAFAVAARSYATFYVDAEGGNRKFPGKPYDGSDSPANFQLYKGYVFEQKHPRWVRAVQATANEVIKKDNGIVKAAYYSSNDGRTRSPAENGWKSFPYAEVFASKPDPWCKGFTLRGHGVGMSGCGAEGQANEGREYTDILAYYYPGTEIGVR